MTPLRAALLSLLVTLSAAAPSHARPVGRAIYSVRLEGYVAHKPDKTPIAAAWRVSMKGEPYDLFVTKLQVLRGNIAYYDIINALEPYQTAFTIIGEDDALDRFATSAIGQKMVIMGVFRFVGGARYLMVSSVEYIDMPTATPAKETPAPKATPE